MHFTRASKRSSGLVQAPPGHGILAELPNPKVSVYMSVKRACEGTGTDKCTWGLLDGSIGWVSAFHGVGGVDPKVLGLGSLLCGGLLL